MNQSQLTSDSIQEKFLGMVDMKASMHRLVFQDENNNYLPIGAAIFVMGPIETAEVLAAIAKVEAGWQEVPVAPPHPNPLPQGGEGTGQPADGGQTP